TRCRGVSLPCPATLHHRLQAEDHHRRRRLYEARRVAALLRREGLYSSHLATWRAAHRRGELTGPVPRRGPALKPVDPGVKRIAELERQLAKATARAERAEALVEVQKKVAALLDQILPSSDDGHTGTR